MPERVHGRGFPSKIKLPLQLQRQKIVDGTKRTRWLLNGQGVCGDNRDVSPEAHFMDLGRSPLIHLHIVVYVPLYSYIYIRLRVYMYTSLAATMRTHP